jgi:hypothetical protein
MKYVLTIIYQTLLIGLVSASLIVAPACGTTSVDTVLSDTDLLLQTGNVVCSTIAVITPADAAACQAVANVGIGGIQAIQAAYDAYKASGAASNLAKLQAALAAIQKDLPQELAAAHIVDPATVAVVTAWVNLVISTVNTIISLVPELQVGHPPASAATVKARAAVVAAGFPTPESLKARWDKEVCKGNPACAGKVQVHHIHSKAA